MSPSRTATAGMMAGQKSIESFFGERSAYKFMMTGLQPMRLVSPRANPDVTTNDSWTLRRRGGLSGVCGVCGACALKRGEECGSLLILQRDSNVLYRIYGGGMESGCWLRFRSLPGKIEEVNLIR